jgi:hypothetical protein
MKTIESDGIFKIYPDRITMHKGLPTSVFKVEFSPDTGFFLMKTDAYAPREQKLYGKNYKKTDKILQSYDLVDRSLGVILSGPSGMGKSLFINRLVNDAAKKGLPTLIVNESFDGLTDFLSSIETECVIVFDEFEKNFIRDETDDEQVSLLGLFDGQSSRKNLFVIAVNDLWKVNKYLLNRPGRFHYHIRFSYPDQSTVHDYMMDNLNDLAKSQINDILAFSTAVDLSYDCLRAIAFELNLGSSLDDALEDLNIIDSEKRDYDVVIEFSDGVKITTEAEVRAGGDSYLIEFDDRKGEYPYGYHLYLKEKDFEPKDNKLVMKSSASYNVGDNIHIVNAEITKKKTTQYVFPRRRIDAA